MRLKKEVLRARCKRKSLQTVEFLDLSHLELVEIQKLDSCDSLKWLIASKNKLEGDEGLENLKQLWYLDLSDNQMCGLNALSRYLALGTVILTNNNLQWKDLEHIQHAHFLSICLHGNPCLDKDPYYRIHVIDCLPLVWELDGRLVTVTERLHVKQFFIDTELSQHPVRHKIGRTFKTSAIRNIGTEGVVSKQCKYIYSKFPMSETHTKHTDERRLRYLCHMVQEDIIRWFQETKKGKMRSLRDTFLEDLLEQRKGDVERCNMVLLMLVISLEFQLPTALMKAVLGAVGLDLIGTVGTMPLFLLPRIHRTKVICILLNAAKVDRDNNVKSDDGLYPQLFMCLYFNVARLTHISQTSEGNMDRVKTLPMDADYMALMASEVVSLMLQVPKFFDSLLNDIGIIQLVSAAVGDHHVVERAQDKLVESQQQEDAPPLNVTHKLVAETVLGAITKRLDNLAPKMTHIPIGDRYLALSDSLPIKPLHSVIWASQFLTKGQIIPNLEPPILNPVREAAKPKPIPPKMGDKVLLGPQVVGELASLLEGDIAMVKIDAVPISNGAVESKLKSSEAHFAYVDLKALCYARDIGMWRPAKTVGDKYTIHSTETSQMVSARESVVESAAEPLIYTARDGQEKSLVGRSVSSFGLTSQMVNRSLSVGTGYLTGYRYSAEDDYKIFSNSNRELDVHNPIVSEHMSFSYNNSTNSNAKTLHQKKRILSAPATTSAKSRTSASPQTKAIEMNTLHLHDNVHHIRGLTPRAESDRSGALTSPSTLASPVDGVGHPKPMPSAVSMPSPDFAEPETSRANTPAPNTDIETLLDNHRPEQTTPPQADEFHQQSKDTETSVVINRKDFEVVYEVGQSKEKQEIPKDQISKQDEANGSVSNSVKEGAESPQENPVLPKEAALPVNSSVLENETSQSGNGEETRNELPFSKDINTRVDTLENGAGVASTTVEQCGGGAKEIHEVVNKQQKELLTKKTEAAAVSEGEEVKGQQEGDNCPVCLANANEATFLTSVLGQGEGLVMDVGPQQQQQQRPQPQQEMTSSPDPEHVATSRTDGGFTGENLVPPVGSYGDVRLKETVRPGTRQGQRATSAVPGRARFGFQNQQASLAAKNLRRPQSAVDPTRYYVIDHPPRVMATGQAASMFSHNGGGHFKTDFQQQREEAWRRTTRHGRQRPLTAIVQRSSSQFPIAQQHLPANQNTKLINPGVRVTRTDCWLAGGRDLYWEGIRKRPKSGHTPGWLEGLPDSMKKQRPRSAYSASLHQQPRSRLSRRPQSGSALIVSSCYRWDNRVASLQGRPGKGADVRYMLTFSQHQQQQQQLHLKPHLQISLQQQKQQHGEDELLLLDTELGLEDENPPPLCSPVSDAGRQDWALPAMES